MADPNAPKMDRQALKDHKEKHEKAIRAMEKHVRKNADGTLTLDVKSASELGIDSAAMADLQKSLEETNKKIQSGEIPADQVGTSYDQPL